MGETEEGRGKEGDREGRWERQRKGEERKETGKVGGRDRKREGGRDRKRERGREGSPGKGLIFVTHPVVSGSGKDHRVRLGTVQVDLDTKDGLAVVLLQPQHRADMFS